MKAKLFYAEALADYDCNGRCARSSGCLDAFDDQGVSWESVQAMIANWSTYIDFEFFGISGGEPLNNPALETWLKGLRRTLPTATIVLLTDGLNLAGKKPVIESLIHIAPSKLYIVLHEGWENTVAEVGLMLKNSGYRFITRNMNEPIAGIHYFLFDKRRQFEVELYQHVPVQINALMGYQGFLENRDFDLVFQNCLNRKYMPLLYRGYLFKCRIAARLWNHYRKYRSVFKAGDEEEYQRLFRGVMLSYEEARERAAEFCNQLYEGSLICARCPGSVECAFYRKRS